MRALGANDNERARGGKAMLIFLPLDMDRRVLEILQVPGVIQM